MENTIYAKAKQDFEMLISKATPEEIIKAGSGAYGISAVRFAEQYISPKENQPLYTQIYNIYFDYNDNQNTQ